MRAFLSKYCFFAGSLLGLLLLPAMSLRASDTPPELPQAALVKLNQTLQELETSLQAIKKMHAEENQALNQAQAHSLRESAEAFYRQQHYWSAIHWYLKYLDSVQLPDPSSYLQIQLRLCLSYAKLGLPAQSLQAAKQFLTTFLSHAEKEYDQLAELIQTLVAYRIFTKLAANDAKSFIMAMMSEAFPQDRHWEFSFLAAQLALHAGLQNFASQWLANTSTFSDDVQIKARSLYFQALVASQLKKWSHAAKLLRKALKAMKEEEPLTPYIRLALARIAFYLEKVKSAEAYYQKIPSHLPLYQEALYELCLLYLKQRRWLEAQEKAALFLKLYPEASQSSQLKAHLPYLRLRAGEGIQVKPHLEQELSQLEHLQGQLITLHLNGKIPYRQRLTDLKTQAAPYFPPSPLLRQLLAIQDQWQLSRQKLATSEQQIAISLNQLGYLSPASFQAQYFQRYQQLLRLRRLQQELGQELIAIEKFYYHGQLSKAHALSLENSAQKRSRLLATMAFSLAHYQLGQIESQFWQLSSKLQQLEKVLQEVKASYGANYFYKLLPASASSKLSLPLPPSRQAIVQLEEQLKDYAQKVSKLHFQLQAQRLSASPEELILNEYNAVLENERQLLEPYRHQHGNRPRFTDTRELEQSWQRWQQLGAELSKELTNMARVFTNAIEVKLADFGLYEQAYKKARTEASLYEERLEKLAQASFPAILSYYNEEIAKRSASFRRWLAATHWQQAQQSQEGQLHLDEEWQWQKAYLEQQLTAGQAGVL